MRSMTPAQIDCCHSKGRGQGQGSEYQPWVTVRDVPSMGYRHRAPGRKTGRQHVFLSNHELHAFYVLQWRDDVVDIREQFPLNPLDETREIADSLGVAHPADKKGMEVMMTSDFLVTMRDGSERAIAFKERKTISTTRVLEKLEIERVYWERRSTSWTLLTEHQLPADLVTNLAWFDECFDYRHESVSPDSYEQIEKALLENLRAKSGQPLYQVCLHTDETLGLPTGVTLSLFRRALAQKRWRLPLSKRIQPGEAIAFEMLEFPIFSLDEVA